MTEKSKLYQRGSGVPNPVDIHVGESLRQRRALIGISQEKLATALGLTFQQIQKYEHGRNRISASRLYELSKILEVPISYFFEKFQEQASTVVGTIQSGRARLGLSDNDQEKFLDEDIMEKKETLNLIKSYYSISDPEIRKNVINIIKVMAQNNKSN